MFFVEKFQTNKIIEMWTCKRSGEIQMNLHYVKMEYTLPPLRNTWFRNYTPRLHAVKVQDLDDSDMLDWICPLVKRYTTLKRSIGCNIFLWRGKEFMSNLSGGKEEKHETSEYSWYHGHIIKSKYIFSVNIFVSFFY